MTITSFAYELLLAVGAAATLSLSYLLTLPALSGSVLRFAVVLAPIGLLACAHPRVIDLVAQRFGARLGFEPSHVALSPARVIQVTLGYMASFVVFGLSTYALGRGISAIGGLSYDATASFAVGYVASFLGFFLPAGLGVREGATVAALTTVMPGSVAFAVAAGSRIVLTVVEILFAGLATVLVRRGAAGGAMRARAQGATGAGPAGTPRA